MTRRRARGPSVVLIVLAAGTAGCGQHGPLVLPEDARPIARIDPPPNAEPEAQDDNERRDER